ncbi:MAG TPA: NAD(P)-binding protein [Steroidobacteraceae bacterium]|jgi:predicted NAD/FAD-dependent oxidoreductase|nr:NAD(P)-binding protein [Steroidobacteraceae bacterium]
MLQRTAAGLAAGALTGCHTDTAAMIPGRMVDSGMDLGHRLRGSALRGTALPTPDERRRARVVVAGGGIAGLAACHALHCAGVRDVLLIDALAQAGGNSSFGENAVSAYPWGAHYVPLVRADCLPVLELFEELKIIVDRDSNGRPVYDELFLSADPQERLWIYGRWEAGLLPELGSSLEDRAQFARFSAETERLKTVRGDDGKPLFAIPIDDSSADPQWRALDRLRFTDYLHSQGYTSARLHWYVNYCCRDDYGSLASEVSAWAGLHYFCARTGIAANADPGTVVTWPEGNGYLARALLQRASPTLQLRSLVTRIARAGAGVEVDYFDAATARSVRVTADRAVVCLPRFVAAHVVEAGPGLLTPTAVDFSYAPWMVANLTLSQMPGGPGQALAWDNVIYDSELLGYVVATHQSLAQRQRDTVITYYWPLTEHDPATSRTLAAKRPLSEWQNTVAADLLRVHPELRGRIENMDVRVWGHAMIRPTPGFIWGDARRDALQQQPPVFFAHSDMSGISIFEEAYCRGRHAGQLAASALA